jgi:hypothetical protein
LNANFPNGESNYWYGKMSKVKNSVDRFMDTINGSGRSSFFWESIGYRRQTVDRWHEEGLPTHVRTGGYLGQWGKAPYDYFGLDWVNFAPVSHHYSPAFEESKLKDEGDSEVVVDSNGIVLRRTKASRSLLQVLEYPVKDQRSYERILFRLVAKSSERWDRNKWEQWQQKTLLLQTPIAVFAVGFFAIIRELMGDEEGLVAFYTNPELVRRILREHCDFCTELIRRTREKTRVDFCYLWEDMSYKNGMLISPAFFEEFISPEACRFINSVKSNGISTVLVDSDGDIRELIPLYRNCGASGFLPFEVQAGMDIRDIRKRYSELIVIGGIDKLAVARGGKCLEEEIAEKVRPMIEQGRYIPSLDHQAHPEMPLANYGEYVDRVKKLLSQQCTT